MFSEILSILQNDKCVNALVFAVTSSVGVGRVDREGFGQSLANLCPGKFAISFGDLYRLGGRLFDISDAEIASLSTKAACITLVGHMPLKAIDSVETNGVLVSAG